MRKGLTYINLLLLLTLGWTGVSQAAAALVNETICSPASSASPQCQVDAAVTPGNALTVTVAVRATQTDTGISSSVDGALTCPAGANYSDGTSKIIICYVTNIGAGTPTLTLSLGGASSTHWNITEWSGVMTSSPEDGDEEGTDTASPFGVPSALTTTGTGLIVCGSSGSATISSTTPASGFTALLNSGTRDYSQYRIGGATTSDCAYTATGPGTTANAMLGLKEAAAGGGATPRGLLLGVYP